MPGVLLGRGWVCCATLTFAMLSMVKLGYFVRTFPSLSWHGSSFLGFMFAFTAHNTALRNRYTATPLSFDWKAVPGLGSGVESCLVYDVYVSHIRAWLRGIAIPTAVTATAAATAAVAGETITPTTAL